MLSNEEINNSELRERVRTLLRQHWVDISPGSGYTAPNPQHYPWQWLWDSCFHSLIWTELGDERGIEELSQALEGAYASGCVPHMRYQLNPCHHEDLWGRTGASSLTGPPMYGHAIAELIRRGAHVPEQLVAQAAAALEFLLTKRRRHRNHRADLPVPPLGIRRGRRPSLGRLLPRRRWRRTLERAQELAGWRD